MVRRVLLTAVAATLLLGAAVPAEATVTRKKAMWGPAFKDGVSQFPIYADLGVGIWQYTVMWNQVAPTRPEDPRDPADPAYRWPVGLDAAIAEAARHGIKVSLLLMGTPRWANGGREWRWAPRKPSHFAAFAQAASRRYPQVRHWMIWGEPSKASNFQPLAPDRGRPLRGKARRGPRRYARILDASYKRLKAVSKRNLVIGGNTYTVGTVAPKYYMKALKLRGGRRPRMDLYGHNPFTLRKPNLRKRPLGSGYADFSDLDTFTGWLDRFFRGRNLRVFISEMSWPTDHPNHEFNFYVDRRTQADWITRALKISRGWKRIYAFGYLGLYDDPVRPDGQQVERGLITRDGERKPAYDAFRRG